MKYAADKFAGSVFFVYSGAGIALCVCSIFLTLIHPKRFIG